MYLNLDRIYLRSLKKEDASQEYCQWLNDPKVNIYLETRECTIDDLKKYIKKQVDDPNSIFVGIFDKISDKHIGNIKLEPIDWKKKEATLGILIGDMNYWNKGIATEAIRGIVNYSFNNLKLKRIELGVINENLGAIRCYEKVGFKKVKTKKNGANHNGRLYDTIIMEYK